VPRYAVALLVKKHLIITYVRTEGGEGFQKASRTLITGKRREKEKSYVRFSVLYEPQKAIEKNVGRYL